MKGDALYATVLGWPGEYAVIETLKCLHPDEIQSIKMLGVNQELEWKLTSNALVIKTPDQKHCDHAYVFKIVRGQPYQQNFPHLSRESNNDLKMSSAAGMPGTSASSNCKLKRAGVYVRRRPERSAAYQVVRENLETWPASQQLHRPRATKPIGRRAQGPGSGLGLSILQATCERYGTELKL